MDCKNESKNSHIHCNCHSVQHENEEENSTLLIIRLVLGVVLFILGYFYQNDFIYTVSYLVLGYDVIVNGVKDIKNIFNEHFLMSIATVGAIIIGKIPEAVSVMMFYQIGELLSDFATEKSKKSIGDLIDLRSDTATVLKGSVFQTISSTEVNIGDIIKVLPGEKIPLDGIVIEGSAYLDTKSLTGESVLKRAAEGDSVLSGFVCTDSTLKIKVTKTYENSTASKIMELISDDKKSHSEKFITKFARCYTPIVVLFAILLIVVPTVSGQDFKVWFYRSMLFLVISCPCALVVSVPLSFFSGLGCASKNGILVKGAFTLEEASKIKQIAFDKTGTLTYGDFAVQKVYSTKFDKFTLLKYAAYAEYYSPHPIAKAILSAYNNEVDESIISDYKEFLGKGSFAKIDGHSVKIGSGQFIGCEKEDSCVFVSVDNEFAGKIIISDTIKEDAKSTVSELKKAGINSVILTGDSKNNAKATANALDLDYYCELLPQDKAAKLELLKSGQTTAFIGDGINDAPVLSKADVGIAMGKIGTDAAILASDVVITSDNLIKIPILIKISKKTMSIVKQNIYFAILVKILVMILGAFGIASMWLAVFSDVGVCIIAVLNSLRAFFIKD